MRRGKTAITAVLLLALAAAGCGDDDGGATTTAAAPETTPTTEAAPPSTCPAAPFTGTASSGGDGGANAPFSLTDGDIVLAQAFALSPGVQYTVYLSDYDLGDQDVGRDTVEAAPGQVVITLQARNPEGAGIAIGSPYEETFVIMDSGGGAMGMPDDPAGTVTFLEVGDDRICFEVDFTDTGRVLRGTVSAEIIGCW